ncbi:MAG: MFS transporter [Lysobacter sp.]|nr:MFS transporter [Lysobacter sp.]
MRTTQIDAAAHAAADIPTARIVRVWLLCFLIVLSDGFDLLLISYAAPGMAREWDIPKSSLGTILSASAVGMVVGLIAQGYLSERLGRKPVILGSLLLFGACSLVSAGARSADQMIALRLLGGLGMGAVAPNVFTLTAEFAPSHLRARMLIAMNVGVPIGGLGAGAAGALLLAEHGWRVLFAIGGVLPLLLAGVVFFALPESPAFLALREARREAPRSGAAAAGAVDPPPVRGGLAALLSGELRFRTLILWMLCGINLFLLYSIQGWLPLILTASGMPENLASLSGVFMGLGVILASLPLGWSADRFGTARTLKVCFWAAAAAFVLTAHFLQAPLSFLLTGCVLLGVTSGGGQLLVTALGTMSYPTAVRATGVGFVTIAGRVGAISGPALCGVLLGAGLSEKWLLILMSVPAAIGALGSGAAQRFDSGRSNAS